MCYFDRTAFLPHRQAGSGRFYIGDFMEKTEQIWNVSDVNRAVREIVENSLMPFWLRGEVGSLLIHRSGHVYFTLKDAKSQIRGVYFGGGAACNRLKIANGTLIEAFGNLTVYEVRGEYQFSVRQLRIAGVGDLQQRFEAIRNKLAAEGLFDTARKRPIPVLPRRIGVVTSPQGAAIRDFLQIINRRFPNVNIRIYPCAVQGADVAGQIARGLDFFSRTRSADVVVVTRGGGSMEDLWPFNEEVVARAVANCSVPVISAVGHEIDFTICDFAADLRVPTPSAAAELVIGKRQEMLESLDRFDKDLHNILNLTLTRLKGRLEQAAGSFVFKEPAHLIKMRRQQIDELESRLHNSAERWLLTNSAKLDQFANTLNTLNPDRQLERGYAILFDPAAGKPVTTAKVAIGTQLQARLADGELTVKVQQSRPRT